MRFRAAAGLLCAGLLASSGCAAPAEEASGSDVPATASSSAAAPSTLSRSPVHGSSSPARAVPESLQFEATTVDGGTFEGASLLGKPTLLWFWAPWCPTCRSQIPQVQDIADAEGDAVQVVGVGSLDDADAIAGFADDASGITHLTDEKGAVWRHFGVVEQSSFVLLDAEGHEVLSVGYGGADDLDDRINELVG